MASNEGSVHRRLQCLSSYVQKKLLGQLSSWFHIELFIIPPTARIPKLTSSRKNASIKLVVLLIINFLPKKDKAYTIWIKKCSRQNFIFLNTFIYSIYIYFLISFAEMNLNLKHSFKEKVKCFAFFIFFSFT